MAAVKVPKIDAKGDVARRRPIYADVEELILPGFIAQEVAFGESNLSLRTMFPSEALILRHRVGLHGTGRTWREWALAASVWMVDGQNLLGESNAAVPLQRTLRGVPKGALDALFAVYTNLHNRVGAALHRLEAFCYEDHSRALWRMIGRENPARESVAGVPGVSALGMNHVQRLWVAYNLAEDDRLVWQAEWASAKLVASATAPKGVKRLNAREESERKLEEERRQKVIERVYHEATGRFVNDGDRVTMTRSVSAEDLVGEMDRWVRGERDQHDLIVEAYKNQIRAKHEAERMRHEERMRELEMEQEAGVSGTANMVGYTAKQLMEIRKDLVGAPRGREVASSSNQQRIYQRFVEPDVVAGGIGSDGKAVPLPRTSTLNDEVAARRPRLNEGSG